MTSPGEAVAAGVTALTVALTISAIGLFRHKLERRRLALLEITLIFTNLSVATAFFLAKILSYWFPTAELAVSTMADTLAATVILLISERLFSSRERRQKTRTR